MVQHILYQYVDLSRICVDVSGYGSPADVHYPDQDEVDGVYIRLLYPAVYGAGKLGGPDIDPDVAFELCYLLPDEQELEAVFSKRGTSPQ